MKAVWERWNQRYSSDEFVYGREPNGFLVDEEPRLARASRVLCLAEGEGRNAAWLASRGHRVLGLDAALAGLRKARRLARERGVVAHFAAVDLRVQPLPRGAFDGVVSIFCHLDPEGRRRLLREALAALAPAGLLILEAYRPEQLAFKTGGPPDAALMPTLGELNEQLAGLETLLAREHERDVIEGRLHRGRAALVQWVGRKAPC